MILSDRYTEYLADPGSRWRSLADALAESRLPLESALLRRFGASGAHTATVGDEGGPWAGRRVHLSPTLPAPSVGELWFDPCELSTMLVVPGVPEEETLTWAPSARAQWRREHGWLSLRPVAVWQFAGFLRWVPVRPRRVVVQPEIALLDPGRLLAGDEERPMTAACVTEAALYWCWFGKLGAGQSDWEAARRLLDERAYDALWGASRREWGGGLHEQDAFVALTKELVDIDYLDEFERDEAEPPPVRRFFGEYEAPGDVGLRTAIPVREGLLAEPLSDGALELLDVLPRRRWR